jgi:hypothetical protein
MLAYRAVARESYYKRKQFESTPSLEQYAAMHSVQEEVQFSEQFENIFRRFSKARQTLKR